MLDKLVELQTYEYDAYLERAVPRAVVFVQSTEQVSAVLKVLAEENVPFVPRGCGTNLSGGSLALNGAVVLEMGRMNKVLEIDIPNQRMTVQVGIFNLDISTILSPLGYYYAPDPGQPEGLLAGRQHRGERRWTPLLQVRGHFQSRARYRGGPRPTARSSGWEARTPTPSAWI